METPERLDIGDGPRGDKLDKISPYLKQGRSIDRK